MWSKNYELQRIFIGRFSYESDLLEEIKNFCNENDIRTGWISIIGAVKQVTLGFYDQIKHSYTYLDQGSLSNGENYEIAICTGNISVKDGKPFAHVHIVVTDKQGQAYGGHVMPGTIIFAGEFMVQAFKGDDLVRDIDKETSLPLWVQ